MAGSLLYAMQKSVTSHFSLLYEEAASFFENR